MRVQDFDYELPEELIARYPSEDRASSRLLVVDGKDVSHQRFSDVASLLNPNDLLVVNNTKVLAARLFAKKSTGGRVEILIERIESSCVALAHLKSSRSPGPGTTLTLFADSDCQRPLPVTVEMKEREGALFRLIFQGSVTEVLDQAGHMPLPPYMHREDEDADRLRYQTVFAKDAGAVAAPTAGLHFNERLLDRIRQQGTDIQEITLHIGAGTFQPVKVDKVESHVMHSEWLQVDAALCDAVKATRAKGGRVVAVGTTVVRALETASQGGELHPFEGFTDIFIYPGYRFQSVDALITNFHLPKSTLLMLVSAFAGKEHIFSAYREAIRERYGFFSYGDAMFLYPD